MLTTTPQLRVRRPSPTTAEFTVTTCPPITLPLRLALAAVFVGRAMLLLGAFLMLHSVYLLSAWAPPLTTYTSTPPLFSDDFIWYAIWRTHESPLGQACTRLVAQAPIGVVVAGCICALMLAVRRIHTTESLLVLRGLGVQTASTGPTVFWGLGGGAKTRFIPTEKIRDVLINEAPRGFAIHYYLVVVVEGETDVLVVFPKLLPRRHIVEAVWRGVKGCLYETASAGAGRGVAKDGKKEGGIDKT